MTNENEDLLEIARIGQGDAESFARLYNKYRDRVYGFAYRMLSARSAAEDVTQEVFLVIIQHPEKYRPERGSMLTFLCAIARNNILNQLRRHNYKMVDDYNEDELDLLSDGNETNPLAALIDQEVTAKVEECIALLPPLQREVIVLRKFQELSYQEISVVTGAEVNVVKARLHRARQSLARSLSPYMNLKGGDCHELRRN